MMRITQGNFKIPLIDKFLDNEETRKLFLDRFKGDHSISHFLRIMIGLHLPQSQAWVIPLVTPRRGPSD